jgi:hypothetical protein
VFLVIQWVQARQYIQGQVDWNGVGNDTMAWFQSLSAQVSSSHIFGTLGIPATSGLEKIGGHVSEFLMEHVICVLINLKSCAGPEKKKSI